MYKFVFIFYFISFSICFSQNKEIKLTKLENAGTIHFSIVDKVPYKNECDSFKGKEKILCYEKSLRNQILEKIDSNEKYKGEMYVWFTVTKKGKLIDVQTKGYPASAVFEEKIVEAVKKLNLDKSTYNGKPVNVRCYTRVLPETF